MQRIIDVLVKKYSRKVLTTLEEKNLITPEIRKAILDGFNELGRELSLKFVKR